jgi:DNA-binding MarR family transcriptional regulator
MGGDNLGRRYSRLHIDSARFVPSWLSHLNNRLSSGASQIYLRRFGVGINEWRVISMLSQEPLITAARVGQVLGLHKAIVSRSVHDLESKKLLTFEFRAGQRLLALTENGHALHDEMVVVALARERMLLAGFSDKEREVLLGLLRRMYANLPAVDAIDPGDVATVLSLSSGQPAAQAPVHAPATTMAASLHANGGAAAETFHNHAG